VRTLGTIRRSGAWLVPADSRYRSWFGHIQLDLRQARIGATDMRIHARTLFGVIDLLVPEGVEVEIRARSRMGRIRQEHSAPAAFGAPRIVLTGGSTFGEIRVRHRRLWENLVRRLIGR
jgi:Cell wall-active antibiotics response 4TMS YvqF